ncbi:DUF417 family protein [Micromonospora sp. NPDC023966]|uniref:DUF417 family protein n=1 Tax=Micromonospora sp. NPDC023966 TaxID=3154699 RepID=UPI0033D4690F
MGTRHATADDLASVGLSVLRSALATNILWIGALKFKQYEVENDEPLVTSSPLFSRFCEKLGAQKLNRLIGVTEITVGSLIAAKPLAPRASAIGSIGAVGMFLTTLSFLATTPEARQEGRRCSSVPLSLQLPSRCAPLATDNPRQGAFGALDAEDHDSAAAVSSTLHPGEAVRSRCAVDDRVVAVVGQADPVSIGGCSSAVRPGPARCQ